MKKHIKVLSVIGFILIILVLSTTFEPSRYIPESIAILALGAYAWNIIKSRNLMLWISGFFAVVYVTVNFSLVDLLFWIVAFIFIYKDR